MILKSVSGSSYESAQNIRGAKSTSTKTLPTRSANSAEIKSSTLPAALYYKPIFFTGSEKVLSTVVARIKAKSTVPLDMLTTFNHPKADGVGNERLLAFHTFLDKGVHKKIGIHLFTEDEKLLGQIVATTDYSTFKFREDSMNPFVKKNEKYIYIDTVDNFGNVAGASGCSCENSVCSDLVDKKVKGIGSKLYELLAGHISNLGLDDNKGFACMARVESGSVDFHSKLGFNKYGYTLERSTYGSIKPSFEGMSTTQAAFEKLKKKGLELLSQKDLG